MIKQTSLITLQVLLSAFLWAGCTPSATPAAPEQVTLHLNWRHGVQFLGFYVAQSRGYYAEEGLEVTIKAVEDMSEFEEIADRVATGDADFAIGAQDLQIAQSRGVPLTAIATLFQFAPETFFARADSGIVTPADLAGRSVVVKTEAWQNVLEQLLAHDGLTLDDVEPVPGGFDMTPFLTGEVDVWAGYLPDEVVRARQEGLELVTLPLYEYGIHLQAATIYTDRQTLAANPNQATRFLRASLRGWAWAIENPTEAVNIMLTAFPEMAAERDFHLASWDATIPLVIPPGKRLGAIDCAAWQTHPLLAGLNSTEGVCTGAIWNAATRGE